MLKSIANILVPITYSDAAFQGAWIALSIARSLHASMTFIHIHIREKALRELIFIDRNELGDLTDTKLQDLLLKIVGDPSSQALQSVVEHSVVAFESCTFTPADEICDYAKKNNIDLIVMGCRRRSNIKELLLGSVSHEVVQKATCPVTVVH